MTRHRNRRPPELWMQQVFDAKSARQGGVVRRELADVERNVARDSFLAEIRRCGSYVVCHAVETSGQVVVCCNNAPITLLH